eukprot:NODE_1976_length_1235_cov_38.827993_g1640_i0.p1 GENE.NODE_1976_length_1235_cov_38.827993_g1640_i0~~NODE_1976_length_1235_cov_38.827993_g1640_i0.p1  ORF type:complete len:359 (+),score=73.50 NODE_1976_length_1235_cov_38.827993_g1640_i0:80-1078(+)
MRRGATGIRGLSRAFRIMDDNHSLNLDRDEFLTGLADYGLDLAPHQIDELFKAFDTNGDGSINMTELLVTLRGQLNTRRRIVVERAFKKFDRDGSGVVNLVDLRSVYDVARHPKVQSGEKSPDQILEMFLLKFEGDCGDGRLTWDEFKEYYAGISASIDDDELFELVVTRAWNLDGAFQSYGPRRVGSGSTKNFQIDPELQRRKDTINFEAVKHNRSGRTRSAKDDWGSMMPSAAPLQGKQLSDLELLQLQEERERNGSATKPKKAVPPTYRTSAGHYGVQHEYSTAANHKPGDVSQSKSCSFTKGFQGQMPRSSGLTTSKPPTLPYESPLL